MKDVGAFWFVVKPNSLIVCASRTQCLNFVSSITVDYASLGFNAQLHTNILATQAASMLKVCLTVSALHYCVLLGVLLLDVFGVRSASSIKSILNNTMHLSCKTHIHSQRHSVFFYLISQSQFNIVNVM